MDVAQAPSSEQKLAALMTERATRPMIPTGSALETLHTGLVFAVILPGSWHYLESPEAVNRPGSYLFEPAGSRHTLVTPADASEDMATGLRSKGPISTTVGISLGAPATL